MVSLSDAALTAPRAARARRKNPPFDVVIAGIGTVVPEFEMDPAEITKHARTIFPHLLHPGGRRVLETVEGALGVPLP